LHIHVVNLDRSPERITEFCSVNRNITATVARFVAVDGRKLHIDQLVQRGLVTKDIMSMFSVGALGCAMSNIALWDIAIASGQAVTTCEDDAILNDRFNECAEALLKTLTAGLGCDFLGLQLRYVYELRAVAGCHACDNNVRPEPHAGEVEAFQRQTITPQAFKLLWAFGTCSYSISPKGASVLKSKILPLAPRVTPFPEGQKAYPYSPGWRHVGIDNSMNAVHKQINSFVCFPPLVVTKNETKNSTVQSA
jgi:glycosyl transferase family 25